MEEKEILDLTNDVDFNEYYLKRLGTEVNPNLPKGLYNESELKLLNDIANKILCNEICVSSNTIRNLTTKVENL